MLTRNFMQAIGNSYGWSFENSPNNATNTSGNPASCNWGSSNSGPVHQWAKSKFVLGTGTTKPKSNDIVIEIPLDQSYDCSILTKRYVQNSDSIDRLMVNGIITNTGTESISFAEVGWYVYMDSSGTTEVMLAREVYDTPITIAPGESVAVNINIM